MSIIYVKTVKYNILVLNYDVVSVKYVKTVKYGVMNVKCDKLRKCEICEQIKAKIS